MDIINSVMAFINGATILGILDGAAKVVAGAAILATFTPTPKDDGLFAYLTKAINFLGMNIGKARNTSSVR